MERPELQPEFCKNPKGYLYRTAINDALNLIDARKRHKVVDLDIQDMEIAAPDEFERVHDIQRVRAAMSTLKKDSAELLYLFYYEEKDCMDIATLRGKSVFAVFQDLYRARLELKQAIVSQEKHNEAQKAKYQRDDVSIDTETSEA
jgi:RNA polymerase sigma factor (sigma-70 family)